MDRSQAFPSRDRSALRVDRTSWRTAAPGPPAGEPRTSAVSWSLPGGWSAPRTAAPGLRTLALPGPTGDPAWPSPALLASWGRFDRLALAGRGGMGCVYRARDRRTGRRVAVKLLVAGRDPVDELREARLQARVGHPAVLPVLDHGRIRGLPWFSMPYVAGSSLAEARGRIGLGPAIRVVRDIARALVVAHRHGVVHCDVNPRNVMVSGGARPRAWLIDFGIAREGGGSRSSRTFGTPASMAPEQADGTAPVDPRTDVYGLGATLYEVAIGHPPFSAETREAVKPRTRDLEIRPAPFAGRAPDAPAGLERIVHRCLARAPADRYPSAGALADELDRLAL